MCVLVHLTALSGMQSCTSKGRLAWYGMRLSWMVK